jgi:hypothetical protein
VSDLVPLFLTIHILTAIVAFGPTFAFPLMANMSAKEPQHGLFVLHLTDRIEKRITIPLALTMPISGGLLVWAEGIDLPSAQWLLTAIVLYVIAMTYAIAIQLRTLDRMIGLAEGMVAARAAGNATAPLPAGPGAALATPATLQAGAAVNPAAEMARLGARVRNGGIFLTILIVLIVSLMAGKPAI